MLVNRELKSVTTTMTAMTASFTRREGYPCGRVTLASGLKVALVYKQISQVGYPITRVNFTSFAEVFRHA